MTKHLFRPALVAAALLLAAPGIAQQSPTPPAPQQQNQTNPGGAQPTAPAAQTPAQANPAVPAPAAAPAPPPVSKANAPVASPAPPGAKSEPPTPGQTARSGAFSSDVKPTAQAVSEKDLFSKLKEGQTIAGRVSIPDQRSANLIQPEGNEWRAFKTQTLPKIGAAVILGMLIVLALFYTIRGRIRIDAGPSSKRIERFGGLERFGHWLVAASFIALAITGLNVTFGRSVLLPVIGPEAFTAFSLFAKNVHNYIAFAFMAGLVLIFLLWVVHNIPNATDVQWIAEGGGLLSKGRHPPARKFNAGQKLIFWSVIVGGALLSLSGLHLLFPYQIGGGITEVQWHSQLHGVISVVMVAIILAHIYIGSIGMEGAFDAMGTGNVDLNWAKEHHSLWVEEEMRKGAAAVPAGRAMPAE